MAEKTEVSARVGPAAAALVARPARNGRFYGYAVARLDARCGRSGGFDDGRAFMTDDGGIGHRFAADAVGDEIMQVAAAKPGDGGFQQNVVRRFDFGLGDVADLDPSNSGKNSGFHRGFILS
jgi:hypothetical protein